MPTPRYDLRAPLPPPTPPEFVYCTERLGVDLNPDDCYVAAEPMLDAPSAMGYFTDEPRLGFDLAELPYRNSHGNCYLSVEAAGPSVPDPWALVPLDLKKMAAQTIQKCAVMSGGMGGYSTYKFDSMLDFLMSDHDDLNEPSKWPSSTSFITVTISSLNHQFQSGDKDPSIPYVIATKIDDRFKDFNPSIIHRLFPTTFVFLENLANAGFTMAENDNPWWQFNSLPKALPSDEMTYLCDADLGSPESADCSHIEWSELAPDSDPLRVGPGAVTFLHQNTCYLAISASVALVLTWQQIRVALDALLNICVANPLVTPRGGRAFYGSPAPARQVSGRKKVRRGGNGVTGFDALPPHSNITVFQQKEVWRGDVEEARSCTWKAVMEGGNVARC